MKLALAFLWLLRLLPLPVIHALAWLLGQLVYLLAERFKATQRVGHLKAVHKLPPSDPNREKAQIERLRALAVEAHLDPEFAEKLLNFVISEVIRHHQNISESHNDA